MKEKCCAFLANGIELRYNAIALCNRVGHFGGGDIVVEYYDDKQTTNFSLNIPKYIAKRNEVIQQNQTNNPYPNCKGCLEFNCQTIGDYKKLKISNIVLHHWTKCNSNCIYCYTNKDKQYFNKRKNYTFLPILKSLIKENILEYGGIVNWAGGEISCLDEFEEALNILDKFDYFSIFNSSGIKFEQSVANHLQSDKGILIISIDSGTEELHKQIKQVNTFNKVWGNIKKYKTYCPTKTYIFLKYIILPGINDKEEEILLFLKNAKDAGCKNVIFDLDIYYLNDNRNKIPKSIIDIFYFAQKEADKLSLSFILYNNAAVIFTTGEFKDNNFKKFIFENQITFSNIQPTLYSIDKKYNIKKYKSLTQAANENKINYLKLKNSCVKNSKEKYNILKGKIYIFTKDIESKGKIDYKKLSFIKKAIKHPIINYFNNLKWK